MAKDRKREAICAQVALLLHEERQRQNLSMNAVAERAGLSRQMVSYVEKGDRNPTLDTLLRITEVLGVELDQIIREARNAVTKKTGR